MKYPVGVDFEWFATDREGHVARFTTCGRGPIPATVLAHDECYDTAGAKFRSLPRYCDAELLAAFPNPDDFRRVAQAGLFAYDYRGDHYELVARPGVPITIDDLDADARRTVALVQFTAAAFAIERVLRESTGTDVFVNPYAA